MKKQLLFDEKGLHVHHTSYYTFVDVHGTFMEDVNTLMNLHTE